MRLEKTSQSTCATGKRQFQSEYQADNFRASVSGRHVSGARVRLRNTYLCDDCGQWHVSSDRGYNHQTSDSLPVDPVEHNGNKFMISLHVRIAGPRVFYLATVRCKGFEPANFSSEDMHAAVDLVVAHIVADGPTPKELKQRRLDSVAASMLDTFSKAVRSFF